VALIDIADLATDGDFRARAIAAAALEGDPTPGAWVDTHLMLLAAAPGFGDKYASARAAAVPDPGRDPAVISDPDIVARVQQLMGAP
jgi:hypothetical protein